MNLYQLFLHMTERFVGHRVDSLSPIRGFSLETCTWKPAWYVFQNGKQVYPEGTRNGSFSNSTQGLFRDWDIGIFRFLNRNSISNFHSSGGKCTCYNFISALQTHPEIKHDAYCRMWWRKLSGVTRSRRRNAWTSCLWVGWYLATALRWKNSWNIFLCCRHHRPYGINAMLIPQFILYRSTFFDKFFEVKRNVIHTVHSPWSYAFCLSNWKTFSQTGRWWLPKNLKL